MSFVALYRSPAQITLLSVLDTVTPNLDESDEDLRFITSTDEFDFRSSRSLCSETYGSTQASASQYVDLRRQMMLKPVQDGGL